MSRYNLILGLGRRHNLAYTSMLMGGSPREGGLQGKTDVLWLPQLALCRSMAGSKAAWSLSLSPTLDGVATCCHRAASHNRKKGTPVDSEWLPAFSGAAAPCAPLRPRA